MVSGGIVWLALGLGGSLGGGGEHETLRLSTGLVFRELAVIDGKLSTRRIGREKGGEEIPILDLQEFELLYMDGRRSTAQDYRVTSIDRQESPEQSITVHLEPLVSDGAKLRVIYWGRPGEAFLRKKIEAEGPKVVDRISVESWLVETLPAVGGFGQPLYLNGQWFVGLEYPAGTTEQIGHELRSFHFPGRSSFTSQTSVIGARKEPLTIEESFQRYVSTIRRPARSHLLFATWFDRRAGELTPANCSAAYRLLKKELLEPYGITLDSFLVDDGYQNPDSLWQANSLWPDGFAPFRDELEAGGSHLGLWLPLNGRGLNSRWGKNQGWREAKHKKPFYWLPDPKYQSALHGVLENYVNETRINCFKHDFNFFDASSDDPTRPSTPRHHREAIVDATLEILSFERSMKQELFLSVTSGLWPSPWWLMHADAIWMGHGDYDHDWSFPQLSDREAEMTYRDDKIYRRIRLENAQFPISAFMTHGIMRGRLDHTAPEETVDEWADYVMMFFGRGTQLQELYLSPDLVPQRFWGVLGRAIRWAKKHESTLRHSVLIGGSPAHADPYGYAHWSEEMGILVLRNPSMIPTKYVVDLSSRPGDLSTVTQWEPFMVYPYQERFHSMAADAAIEIPLPGRSVTVLHLYSDLSPALKKIPLGRFELVEADGLPSLTLFGNQRDGAIQTPGEPVDERDEWRNRFVATSRVGGQLLVECYPANGASIQIEGANERRRRHASRHEERLWEISEFEWNGAAEPVLIDVGVSLPPTPAWPAKSRVRGVARVYSDLDPIEERSLASDESVPEWPLILNARRVVTEQVLMDVKSLSRGRGLWERLGWLLVLAVLPIGFVQMWTTRMVRNVSWPWAMVIRGGIALGTAALYLFTPLGVWLLQTLEG